MPQKYSIINNKTTTFLLVALLLIILLLHNNVQVVVVALAFHSKSNYNSNYNYYQPSTLLVTTHTRNTCSSSSSTTRTRRLQVRRGIPTAAAAAAAVAVPIGDDDDYNNDDDDYSDDTTITTTTTVADETSTAIIGIPPSEEEEIHHHNNDPHPHNNQHQHDDNDDVVNVNNANNNNNNTNTSAHDVVNVVFEDKNYFFVSKPPGMICTGGSARDGSDISFHEVVKAYGLQTYGYQPGLLHRLDQGTSGLMVYAKSLESAKHYLKLQDTKGAITKQYLAVVQGVPPYYPKKQQGRIEGGICKSIKDPTGPYIIAKGKKSSGKRVLTTYKVLRPVFFNNKEDDDIDDHGLSTTTNTTTNTNTSTFTLLSLRLFTGRKHQIRASCRKMKCPIVGDTMYGGLRHPVMLLHAHNIVFTGPTPTTTAGNNNATKYNVTAATPSSWNEFGVQ